MNLTVETQADLDAVARDLIERFETTGLGPNRCRHRPGRVHG